MLRCFATDSGKLRYLASGADFAAGIWYDLLTPTHEEEILVEQRLGIDVPTREDMQEIEISSRLYQADGAAYMIAILPARTDTDDLLMMPVTFVLTGDRLVTVRYHEPRAFNTFPQRAERTNLGCVTGLSVLIALLEATVDRLADILERMQSDIDAISHNVFGNGDEAQKRDLNDVIRQIGRKGDFGSDLRDSLSSLQRLVAFLSQITSERAADKELRGRIKTLARDIESLADHSAFLSQKNQFLLDATLGMINIEQNNIIKIFSVAAGVFLPPTLIASIYGMNFDRMPELHWAFGYPFALFLMLLSALGPYWFFKRRGWV
jgi:magnesium transporter